MNKKEFLVCATLCLCNLGGYEIEINSFGDAARVRDNYNGVTTAARWQEIKFDNKGRAFVRHHGQKLLLEQFLRPWG